MNKEKHSPENRVLPICFLSIGSRSASEFWKVFRVSRVDNLNRTSGGS